MKKRTDDKALKLDRSTIRRLREAEIVNVAGGTICIPFPWELTTVIFSEAVCTN